MGGVKETADSIRDFIRKTVCFCKTYYMKLLFSYEKDISSILISLELQENRLKKKKAIINFFIL